MPAQGGSPLVPKTRAVSANPYDVPTNPAVELEIAVHEGPSTGQRFVLRQANVLVGRGQDVDVRLDDDPSDPTLSRRHLKVSLENGRLVVYDLSTNGSWVGEHQMHAGEGVAVDPDTPIWLGPRTMITAALRGAPQKPAGAPPKPAATPPPQPLAPGIPLHVTALGRFTVAIDGATVPDNAWQARKGIVLLALLAESAPRIVAAERVEQLLWPDTPESARQALQTVVSRVRKAFRATRADAPDPVRFERTGYMLAPEYSLLYDVGSFEAACDAARAAPSEARRASALSEAVSLYRGDFLDGYTDDWVDSRRRALAFRAYEAAELLAALRARQGTPLDAIRLYEGVLERDPCREASQVGLVTALVAAGRRDEAVRVYHASVRALKKSLGLPPGAELVAAYESARREV